MKKTILILFVLLSLTLVLASCGGGSSPSYSVRWIDENGNVIATETLKEGSTPSRAYTVSDTAEWDYTFLGWSASAGGDVLTSLPAVTADTAFYARVSAVKQQYTISFDLNGAPGSLPSQTVEYGSTVSEPDAPQYSGYRFVCWALDREGTQPVSFDSAITASGTYYAIWNEMVDIKAFLSALLTGYELNPFAYIPESMLAGANPIDSDDLINDYSGFVDVSSIPLGFGEQWHMVLENLEQSRLFFDLLSVIDAVSATSIASFINYFDSNPADTAHHTFQSGVYGITVDFDGEIILFVVEYSASIASFGEQTVQIALAMNIESGERVARIQIGDANALTYRILDGAYEFAIKYLGVRSALFTVYQNDDGSISGHIYEYLTVSSVEVASAADFLITEDYVSVVGNKAGGLVGFDGYICEVYDAESGSMIGYEVQETLSLLTYNTLWLNLADIGGLNTIKYLASNGKNDAAFYINGSSKAWESKNVGIVNFSRRFDIEFRTQYVYSYDSASGKVVEHAIEVPMLFIQEEYYSDLVEDVSKTNGVTIEVKVSDGDLAFLLAAYDVLIPIFIQNKENVTAEVILNFIGEKIVFS